MKRLAGWKWWKLGIFAFMVFAGFGTAMWAADASWQWNVKPGLTVGDILYADRGGPVSRLTNLNAGTAGKFLRSGGASTAPAWSTMIFPNANATGDLFYGSATNTAAALNAGATAGMFLRNGGASTAPAWSTLVLPNAAATGDLFYGSATNTATALNAGATAGMFLRNGGASTAPAWSTLILPNASATGDVFYSSATNTQAALTAGATGTVLQSAGLVTAPAFVAKNTYREATIHDYAGAAASWTLSADEALCLYLSATNANGACTVSAPATSGKTFIFRNATGQAVQFVAVTGTTGVSITNAKTAIVYYSAANSDYVKVASEF